jgi:hypothetical protein
VVKPYIPQHKLFPQAPLHQPDWVEQRPPITNPVPPAAATRMTRRDRRQVTVSQSAEDQPRAIIFGRPEPQPADWIYGPWAFNSDLLTYSVAGHGEGPLQKITPRAGKVPLTYMGSPMAGCRYYQDATGTQQVWCYHGTTAAFQETLSGLLGWDATFVTTGADFDYLAFSVVKESFSKGVNENGAQWDFILEGNTDVYDFRTGTRGYTENWVLFFGELLSNQRWGGRVALGNFTATWAAAANDADEEIIPLATWTAMPSPKPTTNKRYSGGGIVIRTVEDARNWFNTLRAHSLSILTWDSGKWSIYVQKPLPGGYVPEIYSEFHGITTSGRPNVDAGSVDIDRPRARSIPNEVEIKFPDLQNGWMMTSVVKSRPEVVAGTWLPVRATYYLFVPDSSFASRLALQMLNLLWADGNVSWKADRTALRSLPYDVVSLYGAGLSGQLVRLRRIKGQQEDFAMSGTIYDPAALSDTIPVGDLPFNLGAPVGSNPYVALPPPAAGSIGFVVLNPGIYPAHVQVTWTPNSTGGRLYGGTVVIYDIAGGTTGLHHMEAGTPLQGQIVIPVPHGSGAILTVHLATFNQVLGVVGAQSSASFTVP